VKQAFIESMPLPKNCNPNIEHIPIKMAIDYYGKAAGHYYPSFVLKTYFLTLETVLFSQIPVHIIQLL